MEPSKIGAFQKELGMIGYKFQFVTLAGFHALDQSVFELAKGYVSEGMLTYARLKRNEFESSKGGYKAVKHQRFVRTAYFDEISQVLIGGTTSTTAIDGLLRKLNSKKDSMY